MSIRPRERDAVMQALRAGVVPRMGQHLVQVGRKQELEALLTDVVRVADGGTAFRIVIGEYGAGKTFFLNLVRGISLEHKLVTMHADLNPDRRLHSKTGQARSLYAELAKNMATRMKPDGNALSGVVERFIANCAASAKTKGVATTVEIERELAHLTELVNGYDFASVIGAYCQAFTDGNEESKADALRWLRGEYTTKTEARQTLDVRTIIDDEAIYDQIKLMARFTRLAGYSGLIVCLDEMVNLYKLANVQARSSNYEQVLRILNDALQGSAEGLGVVLGGTPEFLFDTRRGLYSYQALQSRLAVNQFATDGLIDMSGPVIKLTSLTPEDFYVLLGKVRDVYAFGDPQKRLMPDEGLTAFMAHCATRLGDAYFRTPRTTIVAFVNLLAVLEQNAQADWRELLGTVAVEADHGAAADVAAEDDELAAFRI